MKRALAYIVLFISIVLYAISCSNTLSEKYTDLRFGGNIWFSYDKFRYGDLFGISFLPGYKHELAKEPAYVKKKKYNIPKAIDLYLINDSYVGFHLAVDSNFYGISKIKHKDWFDSIPIETVLDTSKINVLLFEVSERYFRYISDSITLKKQVVVMKNTTSARTEIQNMEPRHTGFFEDMFSYIFNKQTNENLEFNAFDYHFITPLRELKAEINYKFFNRVSKEVVVSDHNDNLYFAATIDTSEKSSSFNYLPKEEVTSTIAWLNASYKYYKKLGFDEVYFTIVPNPVSVLCPDRSKYNHLIPIITHDSSLRMPMIDLFDIFRNYPTPVYFKSDTHWNDDGFTIWLNLFHERLKALSEQRRKTQPASFSSNK
jgi:hypothetical protein